MTAKVCSRCGRKKSIDDFARDCRAKDGRKSACGECGQSQDSTDEAMTVGTHQLTLVQFNCYRVRSHARRKVTENEKLIAFHDWIDVLKAEPCMDCGDTFPSVVMDFDHVRGQKVAGISQMWSWGREKVLIELAKCELVCANCHRLRTQTRRNDVRRAA